MRQRRELLCRGVAVFCGVAVAAVLFTEMLNVATRGGPDAGSGGEPAVPLLAIVSGAGGVAVAVVARHIARTSR